MTGRVFSALLAITASCCPPAVYAQFTDPRTYTVVPVGTNQLELNYAYAHADASLDTSLEVVGAHFEQNEVAVSYTHNFGMLSHLAWVKVDVPFASVTGSVAGTNISGSTTGAGDTSLQLTALLKGGKALSAAEFATYEPSTTLALSVTVSAPTGEYDADKLLNLGSHRWSFKPEFAVSHPFGPEQRWEVDAYVNVHFFTDNTTYHGVEILRQDPLPGLEAHISYDFTRSLWASLDLRYSFRGETIVDSVNQNDAQKSLIGGTEASWSLSSNQSLVILFAKALVYRNAPAETRVALKYVYSWGTGSE
jgi:Putative MetA-pathway of phenol degradation